MLEYVQDLCLALILAGVCAIAAYLLRTKKQQILAILADLIQKAEQAVQGSKMGTEKKALVIAQLEAMGITVRDWMSRAIDEIVALLNARKAWLVDKLKEE